VQVLTNDNMLCILAAQVVKVNTEDHKELVSKYNIYGLPMLCIFVDGQVSNFV
jgi:thioredoxin-like negative regulator of GroEL